MCNKRLFWLIVVGLVGIILACKSGGPASSLSFTPNSLPNAKVGEVYSVTIKVSKNNTPVFQMGVGKGGLPNGLTFTFNEGKDSATISGKPTSGEVFLFEVGAACYGTNQLGQSGSQTYTLTIIGPSATPGPTATGGNANTTLPKTNTPRATRTAPGLLGQTQDAATGALTVPTPTK